MRAVAGCVTAVTDTRCRNLDMNSSASLTNSAKASARSSMAIVLNVSMSHLRMSGYLTHGGQLGSPSTSYASSVLTQSVWARSDITTQENQRVDQRFVSKT